MVRHWADFWQLEISVIPKISQPDSSVQTVSSGSIDAVVSDSEPCHSQLLQDSSPINPALRTFTRFPKLPFEIRSMIWNHALPEPRTIELRRTFISRELLEEGKAISDVDDQYGAIPKHSEPVRFSRHTPETTKTATSSSTSFKLPILLRTSVEARKIGLEHYRLICRKSMGLNPLYINFSRDTLAFEDVGAMLLFLGMDYIDTKYVRSLSASDTRAVLQRLQHPMLKELRYLAIGNKLSPVLMNTLTAFHNLAHISIQEVTTYQPYLNQLMAKVKELREAWQVLSSLGGYDFKNPEIEFVGEEFFKQYTFKTTRKFNYFLS